MPRYGHPEESSLASETMMVTRRPRLAEFAGLLTDLDTFFLLTVL